ncbi:MAG: P-loop NTPase [Deltaproteobacteria bacterium]|nr:MAG: P-loop NTPase [Deltaproteobacteria bacterium]
MDPRGSVVDRRLEGVRRIIAVGGGKGGIGKSLLASTLALTLAEEGRRAGLLDLDLTGPSDHVVLGIDACPPREDFGVEPRLVHGIRFMSIVAFVGSRPTPLRGVDVSNALLELLAITRWGTLDVLVVDMPPGLGDAMLDAVRRIPRAEHLVVATGSRVVLETVRKHLQLLRRIEAPVVGLVENMSRGGSAAVRALADELEVPLLGVLPFDAELEEATGDVARLSRTSVVGAVRDLARGLHGRIRRVRGSAGSAASGS